MNRIIGVFAHVDAGKTTFAERLLFQTNSIANLGRVDNKDSHLDIDEIEKNRGITVFTEQAIIEHEGDKYYILDTPGHVDFSPEMERTLKVIDSAILIINGCDGVQGHTKTIWNLLFTNKIPTYIFINKTDVNGFNLEKSVNDIKKELSGNAYYFDKKRIANNTYIDDESIEFIAERKEDLLEIFFEGDRSDGFWKEKLFELINSQDMYGVFSGSALKGEGVDEFFEFIHRSMSSRKDNYIKNVSTDKNCKKNNNLFDLENDICIALTYKIRYNKDGVRETFLKIIKGELRIRDSLNGKIVTKILSYNGVKSKAINSAVSGELVAVQGLSVDAQSHINQVATIKSQVIYNDSDYLDIKKIFNILEAENPSLDVSWETSNRTLNISVMGKIQLEVLEEHVKNRFSKIISFGEAKIIYKETIKEKIKGYGHFEPLRHYAEVHLLIEAARPASGISYDDLCHADHLTVGQRNLIRTHVFEKVHKGVITGSELTDVKITLLTGRGHNEHTEGGDFREATYRAIRQGLEQAKSVLLEPFYRFDIEASNECLGKLLMYLEKSKCNAEQPHISENNVKICGEGPVSKLMNINEDIAILTKGMGRAQVKIAGYKPCHNTKEVIDLIGYEKIRDTENTSSSVFCKKGKGFVVQWEDAQNYMHCSLDEHKFMI